MNGWTVPSDTDLDQVSALVTRPENRNYFLDHLENPEWVAPLARRGFFGNPPSPIPADEPGYVQFPPWPEGRYLARMAPATPDTVAEVLESVLPSENPHVTRILLQAAQGLPDEQFQRVATKCVEWITAAEAAIFAKHFADEAAQTIVRLARAGKAKQGLKAAKALLRVESRPGGSNSSSSGEVLGLSPEPVGRLSDWCYRRTVEAILPELVDSTSLKGLRMFSRLLSAAVEFSRRRDEPSDSDGHSWIWRPAVEDHPQNQDNGVRCLLVSAVRDAAVRLAGMSDDDLRAVVELLEAQTLVHRRIALHVLAVVDGGDDLAAQRIANRDIFKDYRLKHEYAQLLRHRLGGVPATVRRTFFDWVFDGPDIEKYRLRHSAAGPEDEVRYTEKWKRDWLSIVADHLSGDEADRYRELVTRHGEACHPDFISWTRVGAGPKTPMTAEEMNEMTAEAVIEHLANWEPDEEAFQVINPSIEGLGRAFEAAVSSRAVEFANIAHQIEALDPTYVRSFLSGLETAVQAGASVPWEKTVHLMQSVLKHPFEPEDDGLGLERDPGWGWTRGRIATLIQQGVADRDNRIPFEFRQAVWVVLEALTHDPQPTVADETPIVGYSSLDPFTLSINMNRSKAMHAVIAYGLWCRREQEARGTDSVERFESMPEVRAVLNEHLDPDSEPSVAVRAVYGKWLPWLILLDEQWTANNLSRILPSASEHVALRDAAWNTYIGWCPPFDSVYEVLRRDYEAAVERVPSKGTIDIVGDEQADAKLGEHLVTFYWRGCLQSGLLDRWFELADDECAAKIMDFLGRSLNNTEDDIDTAVLQRIQQLWDSRLAAITSAPEAHPNEAEAFAYTFASAKFDDDWSLAGLDITLRHGASELSGIPVMDRLAEIAAAKPAEATRYTLKMLEGITNYWDHESWRDQVRDILTATSGTINSETVENRKAIVDYYVKRGDREFRGLI